MVKNKVTLNIPLDFRWVSLVLALIIVAMLAMWMPWQAAPNDERTVSVTGTATVKAEPDEFGFSPTYQVKNADKSAGYDAIAKKSNEVVDGLKKVGVSEEDIKNYSSGYGGFSYDSYLADDQYTYSVTIQIAVDNLELAQKVQTYLGTTAPEGQITPTRQFSQAKQRELEDKARDEANSDARAKAEKSAKTLGYKLGQVKSVEDGSGFGGPEPLTMEARGANAKDRQGAPAPLMLQPGQEEVTYSVTVVYYVR
jgi:uncharacterized protein